jgi:hypothetical protein
MGTYSAGDFQNVVRRETALDRDGRSFRLRSNRSGYQVIARGLLCCPGSVGSSDGRFQVKLDTTGEESNHQDARWRARIRALRVVDFDEPSPAIMANRAHKIGLGFSERTRQPTSARTQDPT